MRLTRLSLTDFRSYAALTWRPRARIVALFGPNGSGKTNLLEAVSLLVPGRGMRSARVVDLRRHGAEGGWAVAGRFATAEGEIDIGTGTPPPGSSSGPDAAPPDRRVFRLDGAPPRSQAEIASRVAAVWLTPQMDRLFLEGLSGRRRFLDRLVWALEPGHAREMAAHDAAMGSRNRLLADDRHGGTRQGGSRPASHQGGHSDPSWLAGLEDEMARHAVAATASRMALTAQLNAVLAHGVVGSFPAAHIGLVCPIAERLAGESALAVEDWLRTALAANRARDASAGTAALGAHRTDMALSDAATATTAALASTGEQKALLIGVILGHAALIAESRGFAPLLLLDEPAVHLDPARRDALFKALATLPAQTLISGTDAEVFLPLAGVAEGLRTGGGELRADPRFPLPESASTPVPPAVQQLYS